MAQGYELPNDFRETLEGKFEVAVAKNDIILSDPDYCEFGNFTVEDAKNNFSSIDYHISLLKSLVHRPEKGESKKNPFENPEPELTVVPSYGPNNEFTLVYNKFPVVPYHFMLITKQFISQNSPLDSIELKAIHSILRNLQVTQPDNDWFSFYNCGPESGASQPHKHVQFMKFPQFFTSYADNLSKSSAPFIPNSSQEPLQNGGLPHAHFLAVLPQEELTEEDLSMYFASLLQRTLTVIRENKGDNISYNFIMTSKYMLMVPRSKAVYNKLGVNSCGILGLLLCKNNDLFDMVNRVGLIPILKHVGFPSTAGQKSDEYHY